MQQKTFTPTEIQAVWNKGRIVLGVDPSRWRQDACTAWIGRFEYGDRTSDYGWEIDHILPNGGDHINNLQPLQWKNNVAKGDGQLRCVVRSYSNTNVGV